MFNHIIELSPAFPQAAEGEDAFQKTLEFVRDYFHKQLLEEFKKANVNIDLDLSRV
jgi:hypothetical protein